MWFFRDTQKQNREDMMMKEVTKNETHHLIVINYKTFRAHGFRFSATFFDVTYYIDE